jgi:alkylated DNA repair dioxygenase AlkB
LVARKIVELRRREVASGLSATPERLRTVATTYVDSLTRLRSHSPEACSGFIRRGEAEPLIVTLLQQGSEHTAHLQTQLIAAFDAIAEGRQLVRVRPRPTGDHYKMLEDELGKRGWKEDDFKLMSNDQAMAQAPPEKLCQLAQDFFAAQLALPDSEAQLRLLATWLRQVFAG